MTSQQKLEELHPAFLINLFYFSPQHLLSSKIIYLGHLGGLTG